MNKKTQEGNVSLFEKLYFNNLTQKEKIEYLALAGIFLNTEEKFFFEILREGAEYGDFTIEKDYLSFNLDTKWRFNDLFKIMCEKKFKAIYDKLKIICSENTITISYKDFGKASPEYFTRWFFAGEIRNNLLIDKDFENIYILGENVTKMFSYAFNNYNNDYFYMKKSMLTYKFNQFMLLYLRNVYPFEEQHSLFKLNKNVFNPTNFNTKEAEKELKNTYKVIDFIDKK